MAVPGDVVHGRSPTDVEQRVLKALLAQRFPGKDELVGQLPGLVVVPYGGGDLSLELHPSSGRAADLKYAIPVEAEFPDHPGLVHVLLFAHGGWLSKLEVYGDARPYTGPIQVDQFDFFVPHAFPGEGWWESFGSATRPDPRPSGTPTPRGDGRSQER